MEDKDTELLSRVTVNHLFLGQFEPFRATLITLRSRNPHLARSILQTIVANGGRFDSLLWSPSCPSPAHLTYLSTLELLQFNDPTLSVWTFDPISLRLRSEFLLYIQIITSRVSDSVKGSVNLDESGEGNSEIDPKERGFGKNGELGECLRVLNRISEVGFSRLRPDMVAGADGTESVELDEEEFTCLRKVILENAEVFDSLCGNIQRQVGLVESDDSGLAITLRSEEKKREEDEKVLKLIQKSVQTAHLDAMKECLKDGDEDGVVSHIRFLNMDYGVEETNYRYTIYFAYYYCASMQTI